ncbi:MAG: MBOAT family protein [Deltaproteobacteria bacterium]|nr:MBOAT family protein [Deltaproteobacteria bacterium]MBI3391483.1 MBOAT family protein [Deltaproteobacteria bacterium]
MIFNTWVYALFLIVAFCTYWLAPARWRPVVLTGFGFYFYWYYYPIHVLLITATTLLVFGLSFLVPPSAGRRRRFAFIVGVGGCIGLLGYYKYQGFFFESLALVFPGAQPIQAASAQLRAPLAISFFIFEYVHYLIEVYRGTFPPAGLRDFTLFIMFFPTLICGPIKRFQQFNPQEYAQRALDPANVSAGLERILFGLAKKTLIADTVAPLCAPVFAHPEAYTWVQLWLAVYGYALQIYFDFSGYSDIAIGSAKLFGYTVQENFNYPYLQPNIARFWRCWHISLTSWITDYLYIPLGGSRHGELRSYLNRFVAMTLCGLWHGAAFHFMVWGMYHGIALNLYRVYGRVRERLLGPKQGEGPVALRVAAGVFTFHFVCIGWVLFVCDLDKASLIIARLLGVR